MSDPTPVIDPKPTDPQPADPLNGLTPDQQREIDRRMAAARKEGEKNGKTAAEQALDAKRKTEDEERQRQRDLEAGKFDEVRRSIETERDSIRTERDAIKAENERYANVVATVLAEREQVLNATEDKALKDAYPKDGTPLERLTWLDDPRTKAALAVATEAAKVATAQGQPRTPITPRPTGPVKPEIKPQAGIVW